MASEVKLGTMSVTFKDPDTLHDAIREHATESINKEFKDKLDAEELESLIESRHEKIQKKVGKWFEYSEYVELKIDLDADTITVVPH